MKRLMASREKEMMDTYGAEMSVGRTIYSILNPVRSRNLPSVDLMLSPFRRRSLGS